MDNKDRKVASRLLAKTLAYHDCGEQRKANDYAKALVTFLAQLGIEPSEKVSGVFAEAMDPKRS